MNNERISELKKFVEDFNSQIDDAYKRYENNLEKEKELTLKNLKEKPKEKKKSFTENIFKDPPAWKPNKYNNDYFEEMKILNPEYFLTEWDKERIHLCGKSFVKGKDLKNKDIAYTDSHGKEFGNSDMNKLSQLGQNIITKFINDNKEKEKLLLEKEEDIYNFKRSKHDLDLNKWKYNNHYGKDFEKMKIDKVHYFKKDTKPNYLLKDPFRIPKRDGDYFEKLNM